MSTAEPDWVGDPDQMVFVGGDGRLVAGASESHALGAFFENLLHRSKQDVQSDFAQTFEQMKFLLASLTPSAHGYEASEVTFELAFSAAGKIAFIAEAGITSSVSVTFTRTADAPPAS